MHNSHGEHGEDSAAGGGGTPNHIPIGVHHDAIAGVEHLLRPCGGHLERPFEDVTGELSAGSALDKLKRRTSRNINDLGELLAVRSDRVQRSLPRCRRVTMIRGDVSVARDRKGVMSRTGKEVTEVDSVHTADLRKCRQGGKHSIGFEFGEQCCGQTSFCTEAIKSETFLGAQHLEL